MADTFVGTTACLTAEADGGAIRHPGAFSRAGAPQPARTHENASARRIGAPRALACPKLARQRLGGRAADEAGSKVPSPELWAGRGRERGKEREMSCPAQESGSTSALDQLLCREREETWNTREPNIAVVPVDPLFQVKYKHFKYATDPKIEMTWHTWHKKIRPQKPRRNRGF